MGNFIHTTLLGDPVVKEALSCQVERESQWTNKSSTVVECRDMFNKISARADGGPHSPSVHA